MYCSQNGCCSFQGKDFCWVGGGKEKKKKSRKKAKIPNINQKHFQLNGTLMFLPSIFKLKNIYYILKEIWQAIKAWL